MSKTTNYQPLKSITLRSVRLSDAAFLLRNENDPAVWAYSSQSEAPYTPGQIEKFCRAMEQNAGRPDGSGQLRLIIELNGEPIGAIDLYDCDTAANRAAIAIIIYSDRLRSHGYGKQALRQMINHCVTLGYTSLEAEITPQNEQSRNLFESCGFAHTTTTPQGVMIYAYTD